MQGWGLSTPLSKTPLSLVSQPLQKWSNILAFYLNPNKEHGLGDLLLSCLMNLSGGDEYHGENIQIDREVSYQ